MKLQCNTTQFFFSCIQMNFLESFGFFSPHFFKITYSAPHLINTDDKSQCKKKTKRQQSEGTSTSQHSSFTDAMELHRKPKWTMPCRHANQACMLGTETNRDVNYLQRGTCLAQYPIYGMESKCSRGSKVAFLQGQNFQRVFSLFDKPFTLCSSWKKYQLHGTIVYDW